MGRRARQASPRLPPQRDPMFRTEHRIRMVSRWQGPCLNIGATGDDQANRRARPMKASSHNGKAKNGSIPRHGRIRPAQGELFLGYKALHELRILMRIASTQTPDDAKNGKVSY